MPKLNAIISKLENIEILAMFLISDKGSLAAKFV
jgi:hypothetical protein